jgi:hypothetical protein
MRKSFTLILVFVGLGLAVLPHRKTSEAQAEPVFHRLAWGFPLWKDVPGSSYAVLRHGRRKNAEWAAFVSRARPGQQAGTRPCVTVARITRDGRYANAGACGPLAPENGLRYPPIHPLIGGDSGSFFAISFATDVRTVDVQLGSGAIIRRQPHLLSEAQADKAHLPRFRYIAEALPHDACISETKGYNAGGEVVLENQTNEC